MGTLQGLPGSTRRKVGMTSNHHAPYGLGDTRATMAQQRDAIPRGGANLKNSVPVRTKEGAVEGRADDWGEVVTR